MSVVSCFYYLRIVKVMYFDDPAEALDPTVADGAQRGLMAVTAIAVLLLCLIPGPFISIAGAGGAHVLSMNPGDDAKPIPLPPALEQVPASFRVIAYDQLGSTSDTAKSFARGGAGHGLVIWAREQSAGRGRHGREWRSPQGNLYLSVILRPGVAVSRVGELSFVAAIAAARSIAGSIRNPAVVGVKWPNDILIEGGKAPES